MCKTAGEGATATKVLFNPNVKCCSYVPTLWNFLVGGVLSDADSQAELGRRSVEDRIARGIGVTPLGIQPPASYTLIYKYTGAGLFGRSDGLLCPHYRSAEGGTCSIWRHRNAVCATYFCKFERGVIGKRFWDSLLELMVVTERHLALWSAEVLGEAVHDLGEALLPYYAITTRDLQNTWSPRWVDRPHAFYREAARLVEPLSWNQVLEVCGPDVALLAGRVREAYSALQTDGVPKYLRLGAVRVVTHENGVQTVSGYSSNDMLPMSARMLQALVQFDGRRSTSDVCKNIATQSRIHLDLATVRRLVDFGVLLSMPDPEE